MPGVSSGDARFPLLSACFVAAGAVRPSDRPSTAELGLGWWHPPLLGTTVEVNRAAAAVGLNAARAI